MSCRLIALFGLAASLVCCSSNDPDFETGAIRIAEQFGIGYLPLQMIREHSLIEKHAEQQEIDATVEWLLYSGGAAMNEALLDHDLDIASGGIAPLITVWDETIGTHDVKGIACLNEMPIYLNTNQPDIQSIEDFGLDDRIALPAVGVSIQARTLQMAAKQAGLPFDALDDFTVSLSHPEGLAELTSIEMEITGHFTSPPFMYQELMNEDPEIHRVISSYEVLGGPSTFNCAWTSTHFREENPEMYGVFLDALEEAMTMIEADKDAAAEVYLSQTESDLNLDFVREIVNNAEITFTMTPANTMAYTVFMHEVGAIQNEPESWRDYFFEEIHDLDGS